MSASEIVRRHTFGAPESMGPPALERAAHQLMIDEANRRLVSEKRVAELERELLQRNAACVASDTARVAAESKIGELIAELAKRQTGYQAAIADTDTKLMQEREARSTADLLAAQSRAEADGERSKYEEVRAMVARLETRIDELVAMEQSVEVTTPEQAPLSYRINVVGRDAAGDLKSLELVPIEKE